MKTIWKAVTRTVALVLALVCLMTFVSFNEVADDENIMTVSAAGVLTADEVKKNDVSPLAGSYRKELSQGVKNILLRARQMYEVTWTPLADVKADSKTCPGTFVKGQTYQGVPYGQPVHHGAYVGFVATIDEFVAATKDKNSKMYTDQGENTWGGLRTAPFYSNDCSAFVSYAWGISRTTTASFSEKKSADGSTGYKDLGKDIKNLEPGHAICTDGSGHIILIYDVEYDSKGNLLRVTTLEQVEPQMRKKVWGVGGNAGTLDDLQKFMNGTLTTGAKPYSIIEYMKADSVTYTPIASVPISSEISINKIELPVSSYAENTAATGSAKISSSEPTFDIKGWTLHKSGVTSFEYRIDNGVWQKLDAGYDSSVFEVENSHFKGTSDINTYNGVVLTPSDGEHTLIVRAILKDAKKYEVAKINLSVVSSSTVKKQFNLCMDKFNVCGNTFSGSGGNAINRTVDISSPKDAFIITNGWCVAKDGIKTFEYSVDGGAWKPVIQNYRQDVYDATKSSLGAACKDINSFSSTFDLSYLSENASHLFVLRLVTDAGDTENIINITLNVGKVSENSQTESGVVGNITDIGNNKFSDNAVVMFKKTDASDKVAAALTAEVKDADYVIGEISVTENDKAVSLTDSVDIGVELPDGYRAKKVSVYMIDSDGKLTLVESKCADGQISFSAPKLGTFAIVNGKADSNDNESSTQNPSDEDSLPGEESSDSENDKNSGNNDSSQGGQNNPAINGDGASADKGKTSEKDDDESGLPTAAIVAIVAGSVVAVAAGIVAVLIVLKKKKNKTV